MHDSPGRGYRDGVNPDERHFEPTSQQVARARHFAAAQARRWGVASSEVEIVVDELATNAVLHARSDFTVRVSLEGRSMLVEVSDANPRSPEPAVPTTAALSGRGLVMVDRLARSWGVRSQAPRGKTVWAELDVGCPAS